jgi:hypothetical protein
LHKLYRFWIDLGVEQYESVFEKINEWKQNLFLN